MDVVNEYVLVTERSRTSHDSEIEGLTKELELSKEERKKQAGSVIILKEERKRARQERAESASEVVSLRFKIKEFEAERDRDVRRASRLARREAQHGCSKISGGEMGCQGERNGCQDSTSGGHRKHRSS